MTRRRHEPVQAGNEYQLTVKQHVFPERSISRFAGPDGRVRVFDRLRRKEWRAKHGDVVFCARRVWDQRAEHGYVRDIEDSFQRLAERLVADPGAAFTAEDEETASRFYALRHCRAAFRYVPDGEFQLNAVEGKSRTKDEEERLESRWTGYIRPGGTFPSRQLYGLRIQSKIDDIEDQLKGRRWGVVTLETGELLVPDAPQEVVIPITPGMCLACENASGPLSAAGVRNLNSRIARRCREYWFYKTSPELEPGIQ